MNKKIKTIFIAFLLLAGGWAARGNAHAQEILPSLFWDEEKSEKAQITTASLDLLLTSPDDFDPSTGLVLEDKTTREVTVKNLGNLGFFYDLSTLPSAEGPSACEDLKINIYRKGEVTPLAQRFLGDTLLNEVLTNPDYYLESGDEQTYILELVIPDTNDPDLSALNCQFDIISHAWMGGFYPQTGFWDEESLSSDISTAEWLMEMGYETAETLEDEEDGNPALGFCNVVTEDKSQNDGTAALQIIKWSEIEGAYQYRITAYEKDDEGNWNYLEGPYNPNDRHSGITISDGVVSFETWVSSEGTYAYFIEALDSESKVIGKTLPESDNFDCTFTVQWPDAGDIVINEIMWPGSDSIQQDYWIELRNMDEDNPVDLTGWKITGVGPSSHTITLEGSIPAGGFFLLAHYETSHTSGAANFAAINDDIDADQVDNQLLLQHQVGEHLVLEDRNGNKIDETPEPGAGANDTWVEGEWGQPDGPYRSMERNETPGDGSDPDSWHTCMDGECNSGDYWDVGEGVNHGTPKAPNLSENDPTSEDYKGEENPAEEDSGEPTDTTTQTEDTETTNKPEDPDASTNETETTDTAPPPKEEDEENLGDEPEPTDPPKDSDSGETEEGTGETSKEGSTDSTQGETTNEE